MINSSLAGSQCHHLPGPRSMWRNNLLKIQKTCFLFPSSSLRSEFHNQCISCPACFTDLESSESQENLVKRDSYACIRFWHFLKCWTLSCQEWKGDDWARCLERSNVWVPYLECCPRGLILWLWNTWFLDVMGREQNDT